MSQIAGIGKLLPNRKVDRPCLFMAVKTSNTLWDAGSDMTIHRLEVFVPIEQYITHMCDNYLETMDKLN